MVKLKANDEDVTIRKFSRGDISSLVSYWTNSSAEYWKSLGIDKDKLFSAQEFTEHYQNTFNLHGEIKTIAVINYKGRAVGVHTLTDLVENESAVFHAHIWKEEDRKRGIGQFSYVKAVEFFLNSLNLKKIIFKTPVINRGANRVKEKLGIPKLAETIFESPVLVSPLKAHLYEIDRLLLNRLKVK